MTNEEMFKYFGNYIANLVDKDADDLTIEIEVRKLFDRAFNYVATKTTYENAEYINENEDGSILFEAYRLGFRG
jgi:hypothetical protein